MLVFGRSRMGGLDCFCWKFFLYFVISNKVHRQLCWCVDTMNIVFMFYMHSFMFVITI